MRRFKWVIIQPSDTLPRCEYNEIKNIIHLVTLLEKLCSTFSICQKKVNFLMVCSHWSYNLKLQYFCSQTCCQDFSLLFSQEFHQFIHRSKYTFLFVFNSKTKEIWEITFLAEQWKAKGKLERNLQQFCHQPEIELHMLTALGQFYYFLSRQNATTSAISFLP